MRKMGKNHIYIVVFRIRPKFWWMLPIDVRNNHTNYRANPNYLRK